MAHLVAARAKTALVGDAITATSTTAAGANVQALASKDGKAALSVHAYTRSNLEEARQLGSPPLSSPQLAKNKINNINNK